MRLIRYLNRYTCCGTEDGGHIKESWTDESSSKNNDRCPVCRAECEPYQSEEIETDESGKGDIVVIVGGGLVEDVKCPPGLSVLILDRDCENSDGNDLARDEDGREVEARWLVEPGAANADERQPAPKWSELITSGLLDLMREAVAYKRDAFEDDTEVDGGDMVEWFADFRSRLCNAMYGHLDTSIGPTLSAKYNVEAVPERCLLVMLGEDRDTITEKDVHLIMERCADYSVMDSDDRATWPPMWIKQEPQEQTGVFIATTDEDLARDPMGLMQGASPALRNLWRDAQAAGFTRIELTWG